MCPAKRGFFLLRVDQSSPSFVGLAISRSLYQLASQNITYFRLYFSASRKKSLRHATASGRSFSLFDRRRGVRLRVHAVRLFLEHECVASTSIRTWCYQKTRFPCTSFIFFLFRYVFTISDTKTAFVLAELPTDDDVEEIIANACRTFRRKEMIIIPAKYYSLERDQVRSELYREAETFGTWHLSTAYITVRTIWNLVRRRTRFVFIAPRMFFTRVRFGTDCVGV